MNIVKNILGRVFAIWAMIMFVGTMILMYIPFLLLSYFKKDPIKTTRFIRISRIWMRVFLPLAGCPMKVKGEENFEKDQNYIVVCNHNSFLDVPLSSPFIPGNGNKTIAKSELAKVPVFGLIYKTGSVLVNRKSDQSRKESYQKMKDVLQLGLHMCIYPEGTRNKSEKALNEFHLGAFRLAKETGKPLIPGIIFNTRKVMPANKIFFFWPTKIGIHFLSPIPVTESDTPESLKEKAYQAMKTYIESKPAI